jgi:hypothetical protein
MALVALITTMPVFYSMVVDGVARTAAIGELAEIADYTSNTLANLNYLANSTNQADLNLTKQLLYLPLTVQASFYTLRIVSDGANALKLTAALRDKPSISADSWLAPGFKVGESSFVEVSGRAIFGGCYRNATGSYVWLGDGQS